MRSTVTRLARSRALAASLRCNVRGPKSAPRFKPLSSTRPLLQSLSSSSSDSPFTGRSPLAPPFVTPGSSSVATADAADGRAEGAADTAAELGRAPLSSAVADSDDGDDEYDLEGDDDPEGDDPIDDSAIDSVSPDFLVSLFASVMWTDLPSPDLH